MPSKPASTIDFAKVHSELGNNSLVESAVSRIPVLTGDKNYTDWSDGLMAALKYCGIEKILTGEWAQPTATSGDATSEKNAEEWEVLDAWIWLHFNLSDNVRSQVRHLKTSHEKWDELKKLFKPTISITFHLTSIINVRFDESMKFGEFVAGKREHNRLLGELGGQTLPDSYIAIIIRSRLPKHLKQAVAHLPDDTITTDNLVDIIRSRQRESIIRTL